MTENRLSIKKAAKLMGVGEQFLRIALQREMFPFGVAVKTSSEYTYFISAQRFSEYTGIKIPQEE